MAQSLGSELKTARKRQDITQLALANAVGVTSIMISRYERGEAKPRLEILEAIAACMALDVERLRRRYYKVSARSVVAS
jgi:transcriptional regulator with XRE-family HTH domain